MPDKHDTTSRYLNVIKWSIEFSHWYFWHFHKNITKDKYTCLYGKVIELWETIPNIDNIQTGISEETKIDVKKTAFKGIN
jgi:hypothetical protein